MKPATLNEVKKTYIICPDCGHNTGFTVSHLFDSNHKTFGFGPWSCGRCGVSIRGEVLQNNRVVIEIIDAPRQKPGLMLLQIAYDGYDQPNKTPIYLVFDEMIYSHSLLPNGEMKPDYDEKSSYFIGEHTCPTNVWRALEIIEGTNTDPHGILQHVQTVFKPEGFDHSNFQYADWCQIFDRLPGHVIEGSVSSPSFTVIDQSSKLLT